MRFKNWFEENGRDPQLAQTVILPPQQQSTDGEPPETVHGDFSPQAQANHSETVLDRVAMALQDLSFNDVESGFSGTLDYAAPEQIDQIYGGEHRHGDFYTDTLKELTKMFPQVAELSQGMLRDWTMFRQEVLKRLDSKKYMGSGQQMRPIHFVLPLRTLKMADNAFPQVGKLLANANDPDLQQITELFGRVASAHTKLSQIVVPSLTQSLDAARNNPASYEPPTFDDGGDEMTANSVNPASA